jgi:hypothetical protein
MPLNAKNYAENAILIKKVECSVKMRKKSEYNKAVPFPKRRSFDMNVHIYTIGLLPT